MVDEKLVSKIADILLNGAQDSTISGYHPSDIAIAIERLDDEGAVLTAFDETLPDETAAEVLTHLGAHWRQVILEHTPPATIGRIITLLESDDAADILAEVDDDITEKVLKAVPEEADDVARLMAFDEETAGGLMQTELLSAQTSFTVAQTISLMQGRAEELGDIHNIFVVDEENRLIGVVALRKLILAANDRRLGDLLEEGPLIYATTDMDQENVAELFKRYDLISLPVLDDEKKLTGRILVDDVVDVLEEEASEDIMRMVGANEEALETGRSVSQMARYRLPWLASSLLAGFITGGVIWQFEVTLKEVLALTAFIPIVMGISGNVGAQSSALVIRGIATGKINVEALTGYFMREIKVALLLGFVCGVVAGIFALLWQGNAMLGVVVGSSIFFSIILAAVFGTLVPLFFRSVKIDPAIAGGPMVLALNDLSGVLIFFVIASMMMSYLV